jgi:hypothetical protein
MTFVSGPFSATYNAKAVGSIEDGFEQVHNTLYEDIRPDHYRGLLDGVVLGVDMMVRAVLLETDMQAIGDMVWPFQDASGAILTPGTIGMVGQLLSALAKPLVLTPCAGTTSATAGKLGGGALASITYAKAVLAADPVAIKYAATHRKIPVSFLILPSEISAPTSPAATNICGQRRYFVVA